MKEINSLQIMLLVLGLVFGNCDKSSDNKNETALLAAALAASNSTSGTSTVKFLVSDASQSKCYDEKGTEMTCPTNASSSFYGQDAQYTRLKPSYTVSNGIVLDNNTGLMWEQEHHDTRVSYADAVSHCTQLRTGNYSDWRIPTIRELFSINNANGDQNTTNAFYLDSAYFNFNYPTSVELTGTHTTKMMGQTWSSTARPDDSTINYFYNFLDGHIKSNFNNSSNSTLFYRCVRGDKTVFATNNYKDNGDGTVTDNNTGLIWQQSNGEQSTGDYQFTWQEALSYCENLSLAGKTDWRLPDIKELQSIVYYDNPDYNTTKMVLDTKYFKFTLPAGKDLNTNPTTSPPNGNSVAPFFWSSTTHGDAKSFASYMCFGPCWAVEKFVGTGTYDAHGPGAQRSDPKSVPTTWPTSIGDQKDVVQVNNFVRCVRN
ncbi:MAG: DUF1566 domain-containing protein [Leptospiraceae bacterium]|nr:DUF1566 domain-containing protein [Leptospiraceae bacterium]MCP5501194.1 DUF1566 domain-containing protein [Leptospiraceae bacterium]